MPDITYQNKDKDSSGATDQWRDVDANEVKSVVNAKQNKSANLDGIAALVGDGVVTKSGNVYTTQTIIDTVKGPFPSLAALQAAFPVGQDKWEAIVSDGGPLQVYYWNSTLDVPAWVLADNGVPPTFVSDTPVSLPPGVNLGPWYNGDLIPTAGKNAEEAYRLLAISEIAPVYSPATIAIIEDKPNIGEMGEAVTVNLQAIFTKNDAGVATSLRILRGATVIENDNTLPVVSPLLKSDNFVRSATPVNYSAEVDYGAGVIKNYSPSGNPDARPAAIRNPNRPQAAENNFGSSIASFEGYQIIFYGSSASVPANSANVRALPGNILVPVTPLAGQGQLITDNVSLNHSIVLPFGYKLDEVIDLDASNANLTANYMMSSINVADAGGAVTTRRLYILSTAVAYTSPHRHNFKYSAI